MKSFVFPSMLILALVAGCDNKPTEGKAQATVGEPVTTAPSASAPPAASSAPAASAAPAAKGEVLAISPSNSKVEFVGAKFSGKHEGKFEKFEGEVELVDGKPEGSAVKVSIELASVNTGEQMLDDHLKKADFFDVAQFAKATFESTEIKADKGAKGETHSVTGNFDLHGVKKSITFPATITVTADKVSAKAEFGINRLDFGVKYEGKKNDLIKNDVLIKLDLELPRAKK